MASHVAYIYVYIDAAPRPKYQLECAYISPLPLLLSYRNFFSAATSSISDVLNADANFYFLSTTQFYGVSPFHCRRPRSSQVWHIFIY